MSKHNEVASQMETTQEVDLEMPVTTEIFRAIVYDVRVHDSIDRWLRRPIAEDARTIFQQWHDGMFKAGEFAAYDRPPSHATRKIWNLNQPPMPITDLQGQEQTLSTFGEANQGHVPPSTNTQYRGQQFLYDDSQLPDSVWPNRACAAGYEDSSLAGFCQTPDSRPHQAFPPSPPLTGSRPAAQKSRYVLDAGEITPPEQYHGISGPPVENSSFARATDDLTARPATTAETPTCRSYAIDPSIEITEQGHPDLVLGDTFASSPTRAVSASVDRHPHDDQSPVHPSIANEDQQQRPKHTQQRVPQGTVRAVKDPRKSTKHPLRIPQSLNMSHLGVNTKIRHQYSKGINLLHESGCFKRENDHYKTTVAILEQAARDTFADKCDLADEKAWEAAFEAAKNNWQIRISVAWKQFFDCEDRVQIPRSVVNRKTALDKPPSQRNIHWDPRDLLRHYLLPSTLAAYDACIERESRGEKVEWKKVIPQRFEVNYTKVPVCDLDVADRLRIAKKLRQPKGTLAICSSLEHRCHQRSVTGSAISGQKRKGGDEHTDVQSTRKRQRAEDQVLGQLLTTSAIDNATSFSTTTSSSRKRTADDESADELSPPRKKRVQERPAPADGHGSHLAGDIEEPNSTVCATSPIPAGLGSVEEWDWMLSAPTAAKPSAVEPGATTPPTKLPTKDHSLFLEGLVTAAAPSYKISAANQADLDAFRLKYRAEIDPGENAGSDYPHHDFDYDGTMTLPPLPDFKFADEIVFDDPSVFTVDESRNFKFGDESGPDSSGLDPAPI